MRLLVRLPCRRYMRKGEMHEDTVLVETTVTRIFPRESRDDWKGFFIWVAAVVPDKYREGMRALDARWMPDGTFRAQAIVKDNAKTLAPYLASGHEEIDVREQT